ncbi:hypothetical protein [Spiroplasma endosymbiont of Aspidapion aeneum]|uniref:hypothetical protein n=1 Tax=Spiroplasma endosymbiont of Aspidapion aeneum TaxID=3066276 RepID=UPI00313AE2AF
MKENYRISSKNLSKIFFDNESVFFYISYELNNKIKEEKIIFDDIEEFDVFIIKNKLILRELENDSSVLDEMYNVIFSNKLDLANKISIEALTKEFFGKNKISLDDFLKNTNNLSFLLFFNYIASYCSGIYNLKTYNLKFIVKDIRSLVGLVLDNTIS